MSERGTPPGAADAVLRFLASHPPRLRTILDALARNPGRSLGLLRAWITGKRLRARQGLAALAGIDHHLVVPPMVQARYLAPEPAFDDAEIRLLTGPGHSLAAGAGAALRAAFADPGVLAVYGDALLQTAPATPAMPLLRPAFDPDYLAALDYVGPVLALRASAIEPAGIDPEGGAADALLRIHERFGAAAIGHLPRILSVWQPWTGRERGGEGRAYAAAVRAHLDRTGRADTAIVADGAVARLLHPLPEPVPLASLIVPTRDRLDLLRPCIEGLLRTDWPALELLVCDNDSREPETLAYLADLEARGIARVVPCPGPFNFAAMNNAAAALARGRLLVFVNNDVSVRDPDWLERLAREALRPEIGAVGAKLVDGAGRIQHGGIVLGTGGGLVTHAYRHVPGEAPGHLGGLCATHAVSAVTAACLAVEATKFAAVGGFDAETFAVDFNDVDLCLRLNAAGHRTLLVPGAVLVHDEGLSRRWTEAARARHAREVAALKERWGPLLAQDPHYHPGFDPDLSTHVRLRPDALAEEGPATVRRAPY